MAATGHLPVPLTVLYSFRRCPYAMRARIALHLGGQPYELREVELRAKPAALLRASPKASVPVLVVPASPGSPDELPPRVIDESADIVRWAVRRQDEGPSCDTHAAEDAMILEIDSGFAKLLEPYRRPYKFPAGTKEEYRTALVEAYLTRYEALLQGSPSGSFFHPRSAADICLFPLMRQLARADEPWFLAEYPCLAAWLQRTADAAWFNDTVMAKLPPWVEGEAGAPQGPACTQDAA